MGFADIILMAAIIGGAFFLLYRSLWKKKGHCPGCDSQICKTEKSKKYGNDNQNPKKEERHYDLEVKS